MIQDDLMRSSHVSSSTLTSVAKQPGGTHMACVFVWTQFIFWTVSLVWMEGI